MKIINGNEFSKMSHYSLDYHLRKWDLNNNLLQNNAIIYCKIEYIDHLFNFIRNSNKKYILITHDSDRTIDKKIFDKRPRSIYKWFSSNVTHDHKDLINIPLGIENEIVRHKPKSRVDYSWLRKNLTRLRNKEKKDDYIYCNWRNNTHFSRKDVLNTLRKTNVSITHQNSLTQYQYYERLSNHKFIICPRGNGIDTHRLWETLYVGSIPITLKQTTHKNFNLPIIQLNSWDELNIDVLKNFDDLNYSSYWLDMKNWETLIQNEYKNINK